MTHIPLFKTLLRFLLLLSLSIQLVSCAESPPKLRTTASGDVLGVNYTGEGIQHFSVGNSGGSSVGSYSTGGFVCCTVYPRVWNPNFMVTVKWERTDCEKQKSLCSHETFGNWPLKKLSKTIPMEEYKNGGIVYVAFFPNDEVRIYVTSYGLGHPDFPNKLGIPQDPAENTGVTQ